MELFRVGSCPAIFPQMLTKQGIVVEVGEDHSQTYPVLAADNRSTQVPYSPLKDRFEHFGSHFDSMMICRFLCIEGIWQKREISELKQRIEKPFEISKVYLLSRCQNFWCDGLGFLLRDITVPTPLIEFDSCDFVPFQHEGIWEKREISNLKQGIQKNHLQSRMYTYFLGVKTFGEMPLWMV